ncbi:hypothetical protein R4Z09_12245 [Niallia oryzisoli]|uniref:Uncharacterized protein n=1 Tax=Niallia oryzisoli TaxID=1737571 RepID=A0ABZ2CJY9_9BACI
MEYKKGEKGFILEFNEAEEMNFESFVDTLKKHEEFGSLSSNSEFLALILNEGVTSLQHKINTFNEDPDELDNLSLPSSLQEILASLVNESLSALQYNLTKENGFTSLDELLTIMTNTDTLYHETDPSIQKNEHSTALDDSLPYENNNYE